MPIAKLKRIEHRVKALFFTLLKAFLKTGNREFSLLTGDRLRKVLFLRPDKIGDMVVSLPLFDGLRTHYPHVKLMILASPNNVAIIRNDPRFDRIFLYRKNLWRDVQEVLAVRRENYDCVVDMTCHDSLTGLLLSQLAAPGKPRIGVGKMKFAQYYDYNCDNQGRHSGHIIDTTLQFLTAFGIDISTVSGFSPPFLDALSLKKATQFESRISDGASEVLAIGFNLSAGSNTRVWAEEKSVELIRRLLDHNRHSTVILFMMPADRHRGVRLCSQFNDRVFLVPDGLNLTEASALISKLDVLITPDTSLVHIARSFRVPVVGLYSRHMSNFRFWRPYGQDDGAVISGHLDNIFDISVDDVFDAFVQVTRQLTPAVR